MKHTIYCFNNGGSPGWMHAIAVADDGHSLAHHICSHEAYMRHDLGMDGSTWKHDKYDEHFGAGKWQLEWVDDPKTHAGLEEAYRLNGEVSASAREKE